MSAGNRKNSYRPYIPERKPTPRSGIYLACVMVLVIIGVLMGAGISKASATEPVPICPDGTCESTESDCNDFVLEITRLHARILEADNRLRWKEDVIFDLHRKVEQLETDYYDAFYDLDAAKQENASLLREIEAQSWRLNSAELRIEKQKVKIDRQAATIRRLRDRLRSQR